MRFVRFYVPNTKERLGLVREDEVVDITEVGGGRHSSILDLVEAAHKRKTSLDKFVEKGLVGRRLKRYSYSDLDVKPSPARPHLLAPIDPPEVWASGVTYIVSRDAREFETKAQGIYAKVYEADRPELFLKATRGRCVGPHEPICIRSDSKWTIPEPELCFVLGGQGEIFGYTIGNDVSARDIEGENPLYLPQAKIFKGSCALGPVIAGKEDVPDASNLQISMRIMRDGEVVFKGETNTSRMKRTLTELLDYLRRDNILFPGTVCMTGTGIVPPDDFALKGGDVVRVEVEGMGRLENPVVQL